MSERLFSGDVLFAQRLFACAGFYQGALDGIWGPRTDAASAAWDEAFVRARTEFGEFDGRTERALYTILPVAQVLARRYLTAARGRGIDVRILSGSRTYEEQNALFRQGRFGNPGRRVTNARGGQSNHNFGVAWDVGIFDGGRYLQDSPLYDEAAEELPAGVEWGGAWISFQDRPHYQAATGFATLAEVRGVFETGELRLA